jgi:hypothetical protein
MPWLPQQLYRDARELVADGDIDGLRALYAAMVLVDEAEFARLSALDFTFAVNLGP